MVTAHCQNSLVQKKKNCRFTNVLGIARTFTDPHNLINSDRAVAKFLAINPVYTYQKS